MSALSGCLLEQEGLEELRFAGTVAQGNMKGRGCGGSRVQTLRSSDTGTGHSRPSCKVGIRWPTGWGKHAGKHAKSPSRGERCRWFDKQALSSPIPKAFVTGSVDCTQVSPPTNLVALRKLLLEAAVHAFAEVSRDDLLFPAYIPAVQLYTARPGVTPVLSQKSEHKPVSAAGASPSCRQRTHISGLHELTGHRKGRNQGAHAAHREAGIQAGAGQQPLQLTFFP